LGDDSGLQYGSKTPPETESSHVFCRPFWFAVPRVCPVFDPKSGDEIGTLVPGGWFLTVAWHGRGLLVEVDGAQVLPKDVSGLR